MNYITGMTVNIIAVLWLIFAIVFFSFPFEMPATGEFVILLSDFNQDLKSNGETIVSNMNYTCVIIGGFLIIEIAWWMIAGKRYSRTVQKAREEEANTAMAVLAKPNK